MKTGDRVIVTTDVREGPRDERGTVIGVALNPPSLFVAFEDGTNSWWPIGVVRDDPEPRVLDPENEDDDWDFAVGGAVAHLEELGRIARDAEDVDAVQAIEAVIEWVQDIEVKG